MDEHQLARREGIDVGDRQVLRPGRRAGGEPPGAVDDGAWLIDTQRAAPACSEPESVWLGQRGTCGEQPKQNEGDPH
jgi:hypothetical protein